MKHIFIVNPYAGPESCEPFVRQSLEPFRSSYDIEIFVKQQVGDSYDTVRRFRATYPDEELRFYACGGDGTLREVAIACVGVENVAFTSYACGSGNDYVKYYGGPKAFRDVRRLLEGTPVFIDMMKVTGDNNTATDRNYDGDANANTTWAMNATHFGLDARVARTMDKVRRVPLIGKKMAYPTAVLWGFLTGMKNECTVWADGEQLNDKKMLLCTVADGIYVGGSYYCAPNSKNDDGLLEVCLVRPVSRLKFIRLMNVYKEGRHLSDDRYNSIITYRQARHVTIEGPEGFCVSLDGELFYSRHIEVDNINHAVRFIKPSPSPTLTRREGFAVRRKDVCGSGLPSL